MNYRNLLAPVAIAIGSAAVAQVPLYIDLSPGTRATDVTIVPTPGGGKDILVVGIDSQGTVFRWTYSTLLETTLGATDTSAKVRMSNDGTKLSAVTVGVDSISRGARYDGSTWTQGPGLGGQSGNSESTAGGISGDGNVVVGGAWINAGSMHAWTWTQPAVAADLGGLFSDPSSRIVAANLDGSVVVGFKDQLNGMRAGARWVSGVLQPQFTLGGLILGEAAAVNSDGTWIAGSTIFGGVGTDATSAWSWHSGTTAAMLNLPGEGTRAKPLDASDDGSIFVGHSGGSVISGTKAVAWFNGAPVSLHAYLTSLGTVGIGSYPDLGMVMAVSGDGDAMCGFGTGFGSGQPGGGWVVIFPDALANGTPFCFGDGSGTACPCANSGTAGNGCASSVNPSGANLAGTGASSLSADTLTLTGTGMPNSSALYFQGTAQLGGGLGTVFGDGLRCAGGTVVRLGTKSNVSGTSSYPEPGDQPVSVRGGVVGTGAVRHYQVWYRNAAAFCTVSTFNLSNGLQITWGA